MAKDPSSAVFLVAATLRPETMYGQTNVYVLPSGTYGLYKVGQGQVFVCGEHAARNLAFQVCRFAIRLHCHLTLCGVVFARSKFRAFPPKKEKLTVLERFLEAS